MNYSNFVFDLDGTLIDSKGNLNKGVVDLFYDIITKVKEPKIVICTGNGLENAVNCIAKIKVALKKEYFYDADYLPFTVSAFGGALVVDDDKVLCNKGINYNAFLEIKKVVDSVCANSYILLNTKNGIYYLPKTDNRKASIVEEAFKLRQKIAPITDCAIHSANSQEYEQLLKNRKVRAIVVLSFDRDKSIKILNTLKNKFANFSVCFGKYVEVFNGSKLQSLNTIFGQDLSNVLYVGDGENDIECLKSCGVSFALGNNIKVLESADYKVNSFLDVRDVVFNGVDYTNQSFQNYINAKNEWLKKQEKNERGVLGYTAKVLSERLNK